MSPELVPLDGVDQALGRLRSSLAAEDAGSFGIAVGAGLDVRGTQDRLGYAPQFDSALISEDAYDAMSHDEIYSRAQTLDPSGITAIAGNWRSLGYAAADDTAAFAQELGAITGTLWQGPAADSAADGVVRYANAALELTLATDAFADKVAQSYGGVSTTKASIPPPESDSFIASTIDVLSSVTFGAVKSREFQREEAEERARTVMKTVYTPAIRQAAEQIPVLPRALDPMSGSEATIPSGGFGSPGSHGVPIGTEPFRSAATDGGSPANASADRPDAAETPTTDGGSAGPPTGPAEDAATHAAGAAPLESSAPSTAPAGAGNSPTSGAASAGGPGAGSLIGAGPSGGTGSRYPSNGLSTGGGSVGGSGPTPGSSGGGLAGGGLIGGTPGGAAGSGAGGAGGGSVAARPGSSAMGGMGMAPAAGRGGPGGDDDVHATPGYLIDAVNGDELIGTLPLVAPPVLGA